MRVVLPPLIVFTPVTHLYLAHDIMPPSHFSQPLSTGLGIHYASPVKPRDKTKTNTIVEVPGHEAKRRRLLAKLEMLKAKARRTSEVQQTTSTPAVDDDPFAIGLPDIDNIEQAEVLIDASVFDPPDPSTTELPSKQSTRRLLPDAASTRLYDNWTKLLPTLVDPLLSFISRTVGSPLPRVERLESVCTQSCIRKSSHIACLFFDYFQTMEVIGCACETTPQVLVKNGLFPAAPLQPRIAVSVNVLDLYQALFEQACDAVNAFATALHKFYIGRGFRVLNNSGNSIRDPFRRSIGHASQWYDLLKTDIDRHLEEALLQAERQILLVKPPEAPKETGGAEPLRTECARVLQGRCPACFAGTTFGRPFDQGGDIHVALDGNFHHRHQRSAGDSPHFFHPRYVLPSHFISEIDKRIQSERKVHPKTHHAHVPDEVIDDCEQTYEAADGRKQKTSTEHFDDTGLMALVCRHDIPLFLANIDTPGEQQKYSIALLEHLVAHLPSNATVVALYDVGCVLDRSLHMYNYLDESIVNRLMFCTSAMHAYGHEWSCQLIYNPRLREGVGLTDGEGVERLWSRMRKLIGVERSSGRSRRLWLLDQQASAIGEELRDDLGYWIQRRLHQGVEVQNENALKTLTDCGIDIPELRRQWEDQKAAQLSLHAHTPRRLKKEIDVVLNLQAELDNANNAIHTAHSAIREAGISAETNEVLESLERTQSRLMTKMDLLYNSLNIPDKFPQLQGIDLDFIRTLLLARDLKINIRKRAINSFFEWERLDQAVGGKAAPLGTKLHQRTRKAITKRKPALQTAIRKFNRYCESLRSLYNPSWPIPLPQSLPTDLTSLRDCTELMEDVWIHPSQGTVPRWLEDPEVREGIRGMLKADRCLEERRRLGIEADNLCRWFGRELAAVECALCISSFQSLSVPLQQYRERLLLLKQSWTNQFVSAIRFETHVASATRIAQSLLTASSPPIPLVWVTHHMPGPDDPDFAGVDDLDADESHDGRLPSSIDSESTILLDIISDEAPEDENDVKTPVASLPVRIVWSTPKNLKIDYQLLQDLDNVYILTTTDPFRAQASHVLQLQNHRKIVFDPKDLAILRSPRAWLNDVCINGGAALVQHLLDPADRASCALLSSYVLPSIRSRKPEEEVWRKTYRSSYWSKRLWILPIHRPDHWVLCTIAPHMHQLHLFDSLASRKAWDRDIPDIMRLASSLTILANKHGHPLDVVMEDWMVYPISLKPVQSNTYDCGLWVLATIAAVLRGHQATGLLEEDMPTFRQKVYRMIRSLPRL